MARRWVLRKTRGGIYASPIRHAVSLRSEVRWDLLLKRRIALRHDHEAGENAIRVLRGRFRFLNQELPLPDPVQWRLAGRTDIDHLWRFHLHYHEFLLDLLVAGFDSNDPAYVDRAWDLVRQWIEANPLSDVRTHDDAWHPFCISRRLPVWIVLFRQAPPPAKLRPAVEGSLFRQAGFLAAHLERDLGGNHLLENARGLAMAARFFQGPQAERWLRSTRNILLQELPEQILPHGEHFELAPMYHAQMLDVMLDLRDALQGLDADVAQRCADAAARMAEFLEQILHPDGEIPLFSDSALGEAPSARKLICAARGPDTQTLTRQNEPAGARLVGGYWVWRSGNDFLVLDAGPVGVDHLPAHAHSDLSTLEASFGGKRFIVDSGVGTYADNDLRQYCRSTAAHNVLQIDGREQCDTWSRFRMGYRGSPTGRESGCTGEFEWARMRHNAYRRLAIPETGRWVACRRGGPWFIVDWAAGTGSHKLTNRLHLHPATSIERVGPAQVKLRQGDVGLVLGSLAAGTLEIVEGRYFPEFGVSQPAPVVQWTADAELPAMCGWWLARETDSGDAVLNRTAAGESILYWSGGLESPPWQSDDLFAGRANARCSGIER